MARAVVVTAPMTTRRSPPHHVPARWAGRRLVEATTEAELVEAVRPADAAGTPVLLLAGGSNLLVADAGFPGRVVRVPPRAAHRRRGRRPDCGGVLVRSRPASSGTTWSPAPSTRAGRARGAVRHPRLGGATPVQNVGAYGQQVSQTIASVRVFDRAPTASGPSPRRLRLRLPHAASRRTPAGTSSSTCRWSSAPARSVLRDATPSWRAPSGSRRATARRSPRSGTPCWRCARAKGMVLDDADHDTWSAGSFFTNPVLDAIGSRAPGRRAALAAGRRRQDQRRLAHRARRLPQGLRTTRPACPPSTPSRSRTAGAGPRPTCWPSPVRCVTASRTRFGVRLVNEPVLVGATL